MRWPAALVVLAACGGDDAAVVPDGAPCPAPGPGWSAAPALARGPIQETAAVARGGAIYVLGGFDGTLNIVDAVQIYDVATCTWSDGPSLPAPMHHANAAVVGDTIYVLGYATGFDFAAHGDVYALEDGAWVARAAMPTGTERSASAVGVIDGKIYVAGGLRGDPVADVSVYDPVADAWTTLDPLPAARDHGCGGAIDGVLYLAGGRLGDPESHQPDTYAYTPGGGWTAVAAMITGRGGTACGVVGGRLIVVGGEGNPDDPAGVFAQAEAYDPGDDAWTALAPMPTPRHGMAAATIGGSLYVPGGADHQLFGATATFEVLTP